MDDKLLSKTAVSKLFGVSVRRIEQLQQDGVIVGEGKPIKFPLTETVQSYIKYLSDKAYGREKKATDSDLETQKLEAEVRIKNAKAEIAEQQVRELDGELHRAEDVEAYVTDHVLFFRSMLMALPGKLAMDLAGDHTAAEQADTVKREIYFVLNELSNFKYDQDEFKKRARERYGFSDDQDEQ